MIDVEAFRGLLGQTVKRVFLMVWPPLHEDDNRNISCSIAFEFVEKADSLYTISTSAEDNWTPEMTLGPIAPYFGWEVMELRMMQWMGGGIDSPLTNEYYDVSDSPMFRRYVGCTVERIKLLNIVGEYNPFGVKIMFGADVITSVPNVDGNTVITEGFGNAAALEEFQKLGDIEEVLI